MTQLDRIEMKTDLLFGAFSNQIMAGEFLQAFHGETQKKDGNQDIIAQAEELFKVHNKNMEDSISYYSEMFGASSNENIVSLIKELVDAKAEPEAVTEASATSSHTSEKVD